MPTRARRRAIAARNRLIVWWRKRRTALVIESPLDVEGVQAGYDFSAVSGLWLDTARTTPLTADGEQIAGVTDLTASGYHGQQSTGAARPLWKSNQQNGLGMALFDAIDDYLRVDGLSALFAGTDQAYTVYVVVRQVVASGLQALVSAGRASTATPFTSHEFSVNAVRIQRRDDANSLASVSTSAASLVTRVLTFKHTGTVGTIYANGSQIQTGASDLGVQTLDTCSLGALRRTTVTQFLNAYLGDAWAYAGAHGDSLRGALETHFRTKWSI